MNANLSILHLVLNASFVVQLVMLLLVAVSVASWAAAPSRWRRCNAVLKLGAARPVNTAATDSAIVHSTSVMPRCVRRRERVVFMRCSWQ